MKRARAHAWSGIGVGALVCALAIGCGSRSGVDGCAGAFDGCAGGTFDSAGASVGGALAFAGASVGGALAFAGTSAGGALALGGSAPGGANPGGSAGASGGRPPVAGAGMGGVSVGGAGAGGTGAVEREPPVVLILLDASTSMLDSQVWVPTFEALTGPDGPIARYEGRVRFGFASYRGATRTDEADPACAEIQSVPFALTNAASIRDSYGALPRRRERRAYETPTGHAVTRVTEALLAEPEQARKYILLISDGAPDTCRTSNPQCGQDRAVLAMQAAFEAGIETRAIGIGFGNEYPGCTPDTARCGADHFQDIANAGAGAPVIAPPAAYLTLECAAETGGQLLARYSDMGGRAAFFWTKSPVEVANAVETVLSQIAR